MTQTSAQPHPHGRRPTPRAASFRRAAAALALPALSLGWLAAGPAAAQSMKPAGDGTTIQPPASAKPTSVADVGIDQKLGTAVPGDLTFTDDAGKVVKLSDYYKLNRPILFTLVYYGCPRLCTTVLNEMNKAITPMSLNPGSDYEIVVVSFDPRETSALSSKKKAEYTRSFKRPNTNHGWHFLTGDEANIKALTRAVGFRYAWDDKHQQYIHAGGVMVLTPDGRTSKYFYGVEYVPRDIKLGLMEAGNGKIGSPADQVLLYCFQYDPHSGKYTLAVLNMVKVGGLMTILAVGAFVVVSLRRDRAAVPAPAGDGVSETAPAAAGPLDYQDGTTRT